MNDFTKEELRGLKNVLLQSREDHPAMHKNENCTSLLNKIQSLIDKYCEHVFIYVTETPECIKCHAIPNEFNKEIE